MHITVSKWNAIIALSGLLAVACQRTPTVSQVSDAGSKESSTTGLAAAATAAPAPALFANPVLPGDYPDPSVVKVGATYWASATSSNWGPAFPLLKSDNLTEWKLVGHVFPDKLPDWADYYFWAPEITQEGAKTYVFYTAHKKGGNLAVAVASADRPEGPYTDHGPLVAQAAGSIDGFPMRDEKGQLYLIWKEDGNSINQPTPIWAQPLNEARTALTGEKKELFRNTEPWEGNLVEGVSMVRHGDYFYAFYAANGCCGPACTYGTGVARAKSLLGPWEKNPRNPVIAATEAWRCPGHGTVTQGVDGRWLLLHHAYAAGSFENVGRQGVLTEFTWNADNWPQFMSQPGSTAPARPVATQPIADEFTGAKLGLAWQWPVEDKPQFALRGGQLRLTAHPDKGGAALGRHTLTGNYTATTTLLTPATLPPGTAAGLAAHGDPNNALALTAGGGQIRLWERRAGKEKVLAETALPAAAGKAIQLRMQVSGGNSYRFAWSADGTTWTNLMASDGALDGKFLPPWDRGVRVGVIAQGPKAVTAAFERFALDSQP
ncbi:family 43 glycosylhydrolase [Hymenobacter sp. BT683]|uniref:Family 43 glycosylhydrolase n=1 Tax=Hymenobacter jeongseonensis TaxID=2791027 RepID=A0ABS0IEA0_9BACT|nr:family 43 glycosylhydrolase [Hymenobacter jeongseonensis]MBF9236655.1 family 43 glycosylhydrolase [Hymenobacter jeongseonensis]